jgi:parallel beta-helix repeat protein
MLLKNSIHINQKKFFKNFYLILMFASTFVYAQDFYVSNALGSDGNDGSETSPFQTINRAISEVEAGGTVYVMEGIYRNQNYGTVDVTNYTNMSNPHVVTINKSGTEAGYITLKNYPNHTPIIEFDGKGGIQIANDMHYIIVEGFEVIGPSQAINYQMAMDNRAYKVSVAEDGDTSTNYTHSYFSGKGIWGGYGAHHHIKIRNNIVHDTPGSGIRFNDSDHITIENNTVYNTTWWTSSASSAVVYAETIASSEADNGMDIKMIMRGNLVYNNWNRIPFYVTQLPDNSGNENPNYGTADYNNIVGLICDSKRS